VRRRQSLTVSLFTTASAGRLLFASFRRATLRKRSKILPQLWLCLNAARRASEPESASMFLWIILL